MHNERAPEPVPVQGLSLRKSALALTGPAAVVFETGLDAET